MWALGLGSAQRDRELVSSDQGLALQGLGWASQELGLELPGPAWALREQESELPGQALASLGLAWVQVRGLGSALWGLASGWQGEASA